MKEEGFRLRQPDCFLIGWKRDWFGIDLGYFSYHETWADKVLHFEVIRNGNFSKLVINGFD